MKTLPIEFTKSGWRHSQIIRDGHVAIYLRSKPTISRSHWEVVRIRRHNGFSLPPIEGRENKVPPGEYYPRPEEWGTHGFTYTDEQSARDKFEAMRRVSES